LLAPVQLDRGLRWVLISAEIKHEECIPWQKRLVSIPSCFLERSCQLNAHASAKTVNFQYVKLRFFGGGEWLGTKTDKIEEKTFGFVNWDKMARVLVLVLGIVIHIT
jgi:hypothetical protein